MWQTRLFFFIECLKIRHKFEVKFDFRSCDGRPPADGSFVAAGDRLIFTATLSLINAHNALITNALRGHAKSKRCDNVRRSRADRATTCFHVSLCAIKRRVRDVVK